MAYTCILDRLPILPFDYKADINSIKYKKTTFHRI
jgi:hypothetical protein